MATLSSSPRVTFIDLSTTTAGPFNVEFRLFSTDIEVFAGSDLLDPADYTLNASFIDGYSDSATVTLATPRDAGTRIAIQSRYQPLRQTDYFATDHGLSRKLNVELAHLWAMGADIKRDAESSLKPLPTADPIVAGNFLSLDANGNLVDLNIDPQKVFDAVNTVNKFVQQFTRSDLASAVAGGYFDGAPDGLVVRASGQEYVKLTGSTAISDIAGFTPNEVVTLEHFGAIGDGTADDAVACQAAVDYAVPLGKTITGLAKTYKINTTITAPQGPSAGSYSVNPSPRFFSMSGTKFVTDMTTGNLFETDGFGAFPGRQYFDCLFDGIEFIGSGSGDLSFLGLANCRMPVVQNCKFRGSPDGVGVDIWAYASGGSYGAVIRSNHFGLQDFQVENNTAYVDISSNLYPNALLHGVRFRGPGATSGKANDAVVKDNLFYACIGSAIYQGWHTSYSGRGGSGNLRSMSNTIVSGMTRHVDQGSPAQSNAVISATATTAVVPMAPNGINAAAGTYDDFILYIKSGTGAGQHRRITGDAVGATRTLTVTPAWDTIPDTTSEWYVIAANSNLIAEFEVGNIPTAHYFDHDYSWSSNGDYIEEVSVPILAGANGTDDFAIIAPIIKVTSGVFCRFLSNADLAPALYMGTRPRGDDDSPSSVTMTGSVRLRGQTASRTSESGLTRLFLNATGGDLVTGDVVRLGTSGGLLATATGGADQDFPFVVYCPQGRTYADGQNVPVALSGSIVRVKTSASVMEGDRLVTALSNSAGVNNAQADPYKLLGVAIANDSGGFVKSLILK